MNITLKNVKHNEMLSEETHCFSATVYVDGKKVFGVKNAGHGGCDELYRVNGGVDNVYEKLAEIDAELGKEMHKQSEHAKSLNLDPLPNCLEFVVCDLVNDWLQAKEIKRVLRKITYMVGDEMHSVKLPYTEENMERVRRQKWWKESNVVLNTLPVEEVKQYFQ